MFSHRHSIHHTPSGPYRPDPESRVGRRRPRVSRIRVPGPCASTTPHSTRPVGCPQLGPSGPGATTGPGGSGRVPYNTTGTVGHSSARHRAQSTDVNSSFTHSFPRRVSYVSILRSTSRTRPVHLSVVTRGTLCPGHGGRVETLTGPSYTTRRADGSLYGLWGDGRLRRPLTRTLLTGRRGVDDIDGRVNKKSLHFIEEVPVCVDSPLGPGVWFFETKD